MLKHQARRSAEVEFHDRFADGQRLQRGGGLGDDDGAVAGDLVLVLTLARGLQHVAGGIHGGQRRGGDMGLAGGAVLEPALVALEPLLDHHERLVGAGIGVVRVRIRLQRNAGIKMQRTVGAETEAVLAQRDVAGVIAVEIFTQDLFGPIVHAAAEGLADVNALARNPKSHVMPRLVCLPSLDRSRIGG